MLGAQYPKDECYGCGNMLSGEYKWASLVGRGAARMHRDCLDDSEIIKGAVWVRLDDRDDYCIGCGQRIHDDWVDDDTSGDTVYTSASDERVGKAPYAWLYGGSTRSLLPAHPSCRDILERANESD